VVINNNGGCGYWTSSQRHIVPTRVSVIINGNGGDVGTGLVAGDTSCLLVVHTLMYTVEKANHSVL